jgi:hypothetical protein
VLVTTHQAYFTKEAMVEITTTTLENIEAFEKGLTLNNEIVQDARQCIYLRLRVQLPGLEKMKTWLEAKGKIIETSRFSVGIFVRHLDHTYRI